MEGHDDIFVVYIVFITYQNPFPLSNAKRGCLLQSLLGMTLLEDEGDLVV